MTAELIPRLWREKEAVQEVSLLGIEELEMFLLPTVISTLPSFLALPSSGPSIRSWPPLPPIVMLPLSLLVVHPSLKTELILGKAPPRAKQSVSQQNSEWCKSTCSQEHIACILTAQRLGVLIAMPRSLTEHPKLPYLQCAMDTSLI